MTNGARKEMYINVEPAESLYVYFLQHCRAARMNDLHLSSRKLRSDSA